jgi:hypothetical protein
MPLQLILPLLSLPYSLPATLDAVAIALFVPVTVACPPPLLLSPLPSLSLLTKADVCTNAHENEDVEDIADDGIFGTMLQRRAW